MDSIQQKSKIQTQLLRWFEKNGRDLPWRKTGDPYAIWISEIMLQQTQVGTVIPYYQNFLNSFPSVYHLAKANLSKVLRVWEGLGYYSRARNLHRASKMIVNHFQGKIPDNPRDLLSLPGIGRSTSGAILSFAYNKEEPILDGNAKRVLSRLFAISGRKTRTERLLWRISESLIPKGRSNPFNQALMDLGSMLCTPKEPQCPHCPLQNNCKGKVLGNPEKYPTKEIKKRVPHIDAISAVVQKDGKVLLNRRPPKGLLGGLWEFPNWEIKDKRTSRLRLRLRNYIKKDIGMNVKVKEFIGTFQQTYSHFKLTLHVYHCQALNGKEKGRWVPLQSLDTFPMSRIHRKIANTILSKVKLPVHRAKLLG